MSITNFFSFKKNSITIISHVNYYHFNRIFEIINTIEKCEVINKFRVSDGFSKIERNYHV